MKRKYIWVALIAALTLTSLVWYGCTDKEEALVGSIYGTVTDYATGEPIGNVNVKLRPTGETTLTGSDGTFDFQGLKPSKYSLSLSKAEYADLDDDYVIKVEAGKKVKRDVQIQKKIASLQITDMSGTSITFLDFGVESSVTSKSFNIFNNGTISITCQLLCTCDWIDTIVAMGTTIKPGQTLTVTVIINREKLSAGENRTILHIISANGSNELSILATGHGVPTVVTSQVSNITAESAKCGGEVIACGNGTVLDYGLCWSTYNVPTIDAGNYISLGSGMGSFSGIISNLETTTTYYVRAYATNELGTAYGTVRQFTTRSPYDLLPSFSFNGHTYKVAPDPHTDYSEQISWEQAYSYCQSLTAYGHSDWRMPTLAELEYMYLNRMSIGGFIEFHHGTDIYGDTYNTRSVYLSSTECTPNSEHYKIQWDGGSQICGFEEGHYYGDHFCVFCHVRPIRIEN